MMIFSDGMIINVRVVFSFDKNRSLNLYSYTLSLLQGALNFRAIVYLFGKKTCSLRFLKRYAHCKGKGCLMLAFYDGSCLALFSLYAP